MDKLNLGCGDDFREGYINVDLVSHKEGIVAQDLNKKDWGHKFFPCTEILAFDVIEHLNNAINFMDNCWDALAGGGYGSSLNIKACGWQNPNYWVDITHKRAFDIRSFDYFDPDTDLGKRYGYYTKKKWKICSVEYDRRKNVLIVLTPIK